MVLILWALFLGAVTVKVDNAPLRSGCDASDSTVAKLPAGTPIELRFAMSGSKETCYKVSATSKGEPLSGYLPASALDGLESFEDSRRNAPSISSVQQTRREADSIQMKAISGGASDPMVRVAALLKENKPGAALQLVEQDMVAGRRDYGHLVMAGLAAYQSDELKKALEYLQAAQEIKEDPAVAQFIAKLKKEESNDKSGEKLYGNRFVLRYEGGVLNSDTAHTLVALLEEEFSRISFQLGCTSNDRIVTVVQSWANYRATTDAAEWSGGQFDGKIRVPVIETKTASAETRKTFAHEITHACLANMGQFPAWLHEGMAQKMSGEVIQPGRKALLAAAIKARQMPKLEDLSQGFSRMNAMNASLAYAYSLMAVDLLLERYRAYGIQNVLRNPDRLPAVTAELDKELHPE